MNIASDYSSLPPFCIGGGVVGQLDCQSLLANRLLGTAVCRRYVRLHLCGYGWRWLRRYLSLQRFAHHGWWLHGTSKITLDVFDIPRRRAVLLSVTVDKVSRGGREVGDPAIIPVCWMTNEGWRGRKPGALRVETQLLGNWVLRMEGWRSRTYSVIPLHIHLKKWRPVLLLIRGLDLVRLK